MSKLMELVEEYGMDCGNSAAHNDIGCAIAADAILSEIRAAVQALEREAARLDALEAMANQPGGILLHDGSEGGRAGLGMRPGAVNRTLREAIDSAMEAAK